MIDRGLLVAGVGTSLPQMAEEARRAEAAGMDAVYCVEAYRGGLSTVAAIAAATERIRVGPYVLNAYARTPFATGLAAIDLDDLSRGRLLLPSVAFLGCQLAWAARQDSAEHFSTTKSLRCTATALLLDAHYRTVLCGSNDRFRSASPPRCCASSG